MADIFTPSSEKTLKTSGHCLCGKIQFALDGPIIYNVLCHCENCRLATGSLFLCATIVPKETFTLVSGEDAVKIYEDPATQSTQPLKRHFCSNCGSNVFAKTPLNEDIVSVFAGSWVQKVGDWEPMREQFCAQKVLGEWLKLPSNVKRTVTNPMGEEMPAS